MADVREAKYQCSSQMPVLGDLNERAISDVKTDEMYKIINI